MNLLFTGTITDHKLTLDHKDDFFAHLASLEGKRVQVTVERVKVARSSQQNRYYFGIVCKMIAHHTGHDTEQIHDALKQMFSPKWYMGGKPVPTSTARMDTIAFTEYIERCRQWAAEYLSLNIPDPTQIEI